jgi:hypothetical protein
MEFLASNGCICTRSAATDEDKQQIAKLEKKLAKLRKQLKSQQPAATAETAASTESEDSAVAVPVESSGKAKKNKKRIRDAAPGQHRECWALGAICIEAYALHGGICS